MSTFPLELAGVSRSFGPAGRKVYAVLDVSLQLDEGEILAIVGPSGSGKTTLLSLAGCLLRPDAGAIRILGEDVTGLGPAARARMRLRHVGFVFQSFNLISALNVRENVEIALNLAGMLGSPAHTRAGDLLERLELTKREHLHPSDLSGGEQQRLAVARALANKPDIILADEPTASLDSRAGHRVMELMREAVEAGEARGLVVVTHDTRILDLATRVLLMEDGRLKEAPGGG
jgi:putative ABC transport system ATP-binding protein